MDNESNPAGGDEYARARSLLPPELAAEAEALCNAYADALYNPAYEHATLRRQAQLLDSLVYAMVQKAIKLDRKAEHSMQKDSSGERNLVLALQIQKQCVDTLRTLGSIEYMKALAHVEYVAPSPAPLQNDERTGETEKP